MTKISKSDQDPRQTVTDAVALAALAKKKSQHFAVGTFVIRLNVRGKIIGMSKDGGKSLLVKWEDDTTEAIPNPAYRKRNR